MKTFKPSLDQPDTSVLLGLLFSPLVDSLKLYFLVYTPCIRGNLLSVIELLSKDR